MNDVVDAGSTVLEGFFLFFGRGVATWGGEGGDLAEENGEEGTGKRGEARFGAEEAEMGEDLK